MKYNKCINILVLIIIVLSTLASIVGLTSNGGSGYEYRSINNEIVKIYGQGLYKNDSISVVAQGKAQDLVTLLLGVPLLIISLYFANKNSFKGRLLLGGTLGYFLYSYMSYTFLWMYNPFFIVYVLLMSASLFAFVLALMGFDIQKMPSMFNEKLPVKFLGGFQLFIAFAITMLWLGKIAPSILNGAVPLGLEHYSTLVIQGMDLGFIVPSAILSGILLIKRKPMGYLLSSVIIMKAITMSTCISAMIINEAINKVNMPIAEVILFPVFNLLTIFALIILMKNIKRET
jgi:hypothetical protein